MSSLDSLDFITDEEFRASLLSELQTSVANDSYKAALVLAGSIVEALLIDQLVATKILDSEAATKFALADAIKRCADAKAISQRTADLSSVIRSYRNLIHPGRMARLGEKPTRETAQIAASLVRIVVSDIEAVRTKNYGPTAEQIGSKLRSDSNFEAIMSHVLKSAHHRELRRLLLDVLPMTARAHEGEPHCPAHMWSALSLCFRNALSLVGSDTQREVIEKYVEMIRSEPGELIQSYERLFVQASDLRHLSETDRTLAKDHLLGRWNSGVVGEMLELLSGITEFLTPLDVPRFFDPIVRAVVAADAAAPRMLTQFIEVELFLHAKPAIGKALSERYDYWKGRLAARGLEDGLRQLKALDNALIGVSE
jgi:hypothetical protein